VSCLMSCVVFDVMGCVLESCVVFDVMCCGWCNVLCLVSCVVH
jgi:hypothetical protein